MRRYRVKIDSSGDKVKFIPQVKTSFLFVSLCGWEDYVRSSFGMFDKAHCLDTHKEALKFIEARKKIDSEKRS